MELQDLDTSMRKMSDALSEPGDLDKALDRIVTAAKETIPGADFVSITVRHPDEDLETIAGTDKLAYLIDEIQYSLQEGPCYDAVTVDPLTYSKDLRRDPQWPKFGPKAAALGASSQMGVRLAKTGTSVTGLNLYSKSLDAFDRESPLPHLFASHAGVALGYATKLQSLQGALSTRETIGTAIGIVMERYGIESDRAFEFLIRTSQNSNIKLRDIAAEVVKMKPTV